MADRGFMTGRQIGETVWHEAAGPGKAGGRTVVLALFNGRVAFANGEQGTYAGVETIDMGTDSEPFTGTHIFMLGDGSTCTQTFTGVVTFRRDDNFVSGNGTWDMATGNGRFAHLHGGGSFTWSIDSDRYEAQFQEAAASTD